MNDFNDVERLGLQADEGSSFEPAPAGTHVARCVGLIQLGTQTTEYQGKEGKPRRKIMLLWELPNELREFNEDEGQKPFIVSHIYSLVINDKATWTIHIESWLNKKIDKYFNPLTLLGLPCTLTIQHKSATSDPSKIRGKVTGITGLTKEQTCPDRITPIKKLLFEEWDQGLFEEQSEWIQNTIMQSKEYKQIVFTPVEKDLHWIDDEG